MAVAWTLPLTSAAQQHGSSSLPVVPASSPEVLRQKVSVPLEALVEPVELTEWVTVDRSLPPPAQTEIVELKDDPFVDDPEPTGATEAKIPLGSLFGVFGRALRTSVPAPPWSAVRERMPALPAPGGNVGAAGPEDGSDADFAPFSEEDDPFGVAPAQFESPLPDTQDAADSPEDPPTAEDDPFAF